MEIESEPSLARRNRTSAIVCCDECGGEAKGGGYGGFDADGRFRKFCSPECRSAFTARGIIAKNPEGV